MHYVKNKLKDVYLVPKYPTGIDGKEQKKKQLLMMMVMKKKLRKRKRKARSE